MARPASASSGTRCSIIRGRVCVPLIASAWAIERCTTDTNRETSTLTMAGSSGLHRALKSLRREASMNRAGSHESGYGFFVDGSQPPYLTRYMFSSLWFLLRSICTRKSPHLNHLLCVRVGDAGV